MVGTPINLTLWGSEVSERFPDDLANTDVTLEVSWFKYRGPAGAVSFDPQQITIEGGASEATTTATFTEPGDYVLRARVDNFDANDSSGGDQCCWTNGYVPVTVTAGGGSEDRN